MITDHPLCRGAGVQGNAAPLAGCEAAHVYQAYWVLGCSGHLAVLTSPGYSPVLESTSWGYAGA